MYGLGEIISQGMPLVAEPSVLLLALLGTLVGVFVGALPGLSGVMAMAILVPVTYSMSPQQAFGLLLPTYVAGTYGGSISAILLNIPGTGAAIMTGFDGHPMATRGEAGYAISLSCTYSFLGGMVGALVLMFLAPLVALWAIRLGSREYFAVALFALSVIAATSPSLLKGLIAATLGILLSTVGLDPINAYSRFTFGLPQLTGGLEFVALMVGIFGLAEVLVAIDRESGPGSLPNAPIHRQLPKIKDMARHIGITARSLAVGLFIGVVPACGPTIASAVSYGLEKRVGSRREKLGTGIPEGIIAAETANNAAAGAAIVPMMTLGIPGDAVTAVLIGALLLHGIRPGPALFLQRPGVVSSFFLLFLLANVLLLIIGLIGARWFARVLYTPRRFLLPVVAALCFAGTYAVRTSIFDIGVLVASGILGFGLRKVGIAPAPLILGFVLGPILEDNLRRSLILTGGQVGGFLQRPVTALLLVATVIVLLSPILLSTSRRIRRSLP